MCERALGGDEQRVVGSAGPEQALGREFGLCCCEEAAEPSSGVCACPAELISTADTQLHVAEAIFRISLEHFLGQTGFASSPARSYLGFLMLSPS